MAPLPGCAQRSAPTQSPRAGGRAPPGGQAACRLAVDPARRCRSRSSWPRGGGVHARPAGVRRGELDPVEGVDAGPSDTEEVTLVPPLPRTAKSKVATGSRSSSSAHARKSMFRRMERWSRRVARRSPSRSSGPAGGADRPAGRDRGRGHPRRSRSEDLRPDFCFLVAVAGRRARGWRERVFPLLLRGGSPSAGVGDAASTPPPRCRRGRRSKSKSSRRAPTHGTT